MRSANSLQSDFYAGRRRFVIIALPKKPERSRRSKKEAKCNISLRP
jgi:hypothetical protein